MAGTRDKNKILEDSALKLSIEMDNAALAATNTKAALDITTDAAIELADRQEQLGDSIRNNIGVNVDAKKIGDAANEVASQEIGVRSRYIQTMEDRIALEQKLQKDRPIVRYSDYATSETDDSNTGDQIQLTQEQLSVMRKLYELVGERLPSSNNGPVTVDGESTVVSTGEPESGFKREPVSNASTTFDKPLTVNLIANGGLNVGILDTMADALEPGMNKPSPTEDAPKPEADAPKPIPETPKDENKEKPETPSSDAPSTDKPSFFKRVFGRFIGDGESSSKRMKRAKKEEKANDEIIKNGKNQKKSDDDKLSMYANIAGSIKGLMGILATIRALTLMSVLTSMPAIVAMIGLAAVAIGKALYDYKDEIVKSFDRMWKWIGDKLSGWGKDLGKWSGDLIGDIVEEMPGWVDAMWSRLEDAFDGFINIMKRQLNKMATAIGLNPVFDDVPAEQAEPEDDRPMMEKIKGGLQKMQYYSDKINPLSGLQRKFVGGAVDGIMESKLGGQLKSAGDSIKSATNDTVDYIGKKWDSVTNLFSDDESSQPESATVSNIQPSTVPTSEVVRVLEEQNRVVDEKRETQKEQRAMMATVAAVKSAGGGTSVVAPQTNNTFVVGGAGFPGDYAMQPQRLGAQPRR